MKKMLLLASVVGICAGTYHLMTRDDGTETGDAASATGVTSNRATTLATATEVRSLEPAASGQTGVLTPGIGAHGTTPAPGGPEATTTQPGAARTPDLAKLVAQARSFEAQGQLHEARNAYSDAVLYCDDADARQQHYTRLAELNKALVFSGEPSPDAEFYTLQPGDLLVHLEKRFRIPYRLIMKMNRIRDPRRVAAGRRLKVLRGPFGVMVHCRRYELYVMLRARVVKRYSIGIGKDRSTPLGEFEVQDKLVNPTWYNPEGGVVHADDPKNPLGERWIGTGRGYGIHGTNEPETVGRSESLGCIRMRNEDVQEVFDMLVIGSKVTIKP